MVRSVEQEDATRDDAVAAGRAVFDCVRGGGVAIFRTDVGYAIVGHAPEAIERIYAIKARSAAKPCGCFASLAHFRRMIRAEPDGIALVEAVLRHGLPLSIVGRYDPADPLIAHAPEASLARASKGGTMDLLMNAGPIHDEIARLSIEHGIAVFGSSANASLAGSKFRFDDIEAEVRDGVDLALDMGPTRYSDPNGRGSTIVELDTFRSLRDGIEFETIRRIARDECGRDIAPAAG
jgi:tRNA A37 threonylcarbamoyladenosine synthetase subunit TsaC/SUA5/YrdC